MNSSLIVAFAVLALASAAPYYGHGQWQWPSSYGPGFSSTCFGCRGKRSAEPEPYHGYGYGLGYGYGGGVAHHPYGGSSYVGRTIWGLGKKKRSADPEPEPYYGYGHGVAHHPYGGSSYVGRTIWGLGNGYY